MHFLITGGAGFIGSHVSQQLLSDGHEVTVVDNFVTGRSQNLPAHPRLRQIQKDVLACKPEDFSSAIDGLAHLAATPSVVESWTNPLEAHHNNLSAIIAILLLCKALGIPRLIFASSAAVYGNTTELPISEAHPTHPISPYGLQKLVSEQYANLFAKEFGVATIALRMFNVFGPRQVSGSPYSGVITAFADAMKKDLPITIYGDGTQTRDFLYVKDAASAFTKALTTPLPIGTCIACNVGTGIGTSLLQLIDILKLCFPQWHSTITLAPPRTGDIQKSQADISRISSLLNFIPQWSVESGVRLLVGNNRSPVAIGHCNE